MTRIDLDWPLLCAAQQGCEEAYTQVRLHYGRLVRGELLSHSPLLSSPDLEEVEQEVWIAVWRSLPRFSGRSAFKTWLTGLARNVLYNWLRHRRCRERAMDGFRLFSQQLVSEKTIPADMAGYLSIGEALHDLPQREEQAVRLRYFEQLSDQEISLRLGIPLGTVKGRIRSGLAHLRREFELPVSVRTE
jgi:RNA polymerase sigma-70 factor (ECF subfamily)